MRDGAAPCTMGDTCSSEKVSKGRKAFVRKTGDDSISARGRGDLGKKGFSSRLIIHPLTLSSFSSSLDVPCPAVLSTTAPFSSLLSTTARELRRRDSIAFAIYTAGGPRRRNGGRAQEECLLEVLTRPLSSQVIITPGSVSR